MTSSIIVLIIVFGALAVVGLVLGAWSLNRFRKLVDALDKRIVALNQRVEAQEAEIQQLRKTVAALQAKPPTDPILDIVDSLLGWGKNGPVKTILALGTKLYRTYSNQKKLKALPSKTKEQLP